MYSIVYEKDDMIIRFNKDLAEGDALSKFLGHINLQSILKRSAQGDAKEKIKLQRRLRDFPTGVALLRDPALNKGTAFTEEERDALALRGLPASSCPYHGRAVIESSQESASKANEPGKIHLFGQPPGSKQDPVL